MKDILFIDFETRSAIDLKKCGAEVYAKNPTTDALCLGLAFDDQKAHIIQEPKRDGSLILNSVFLHIAAGKPVIAHNAMFEYLIWNYCCVPKYGWPELKLEQLTCTMAMAYAMALPGSLAMAAPALGITEGKDMAGHRVMMQLSQPRKKVDGGCPVCGGDDSKCSLCGGTGYGITWWTKEAVPEKYEKLYEYCIKDVEVERDVYKRLMPLSHKERKVWETDQVINQRGLGVDLKAVKAAIKMVGQEKKRLDSAMRKVTNGAVCSCSATAQLTAWLRAQGVNIPGVAKNHILDALEVDNLPGNCRNALILRQQAAKASTAKLNKMLEGAMWDEESQSHRIRGLFCYHGASTGRAAGRRLQFHNFPRGTLGPQEVAYVFELLHGIDDGEQ